MVIPQTITVKDGPAKTSTKYRIVTVTMPRSGRRQKIMIRIDASPPYPGDPVP
jgi:hypothetical protein